VGGSQHSDAVLEWVSSDPVRVCVPNAGRGELVCLLVSAVGFKQQALG
jgi:hypothetical protein